jgi:hypothetical protein
MPMDGYAKQNRRVALLSSDRRNRIHARTENRKSILTPSEEFRDVPPASEPVGLLIKFHEVKLVDGLHRIVNNFKEAA